MLSPGKWHEAVPRETGANLRFRQNLVRACKGNRKAQAAIRRACREDVLFFINAFVWTYNPKKKGGLEVGPWINWDFQDEALTSQDPEKPGILWCVTNGKDLVVEKSREMGASWLFLIVMVWLCLFHRYQQCLAISRSADAVDCESPNSLFWKIDFMLRNLPSWLKGRITRRKMSYEFLDTESYITGEASTGRAGVGGRAKIMFIDEFSQIKEDFDVLHRTSDTADCRIFNGTHLGTATAFYQLTRRVDIKKSRWHWTQHPEKKKGLYRYDSKSNQIVYLDRGYPHSVDYDFVREEKPAGGAAPGLRSPWYDEQCRRKGDPRAVAMDLDIDPEGSVKEFFNAVTIQVLLGTYCCPPKWEGDISYDPLTGKPQTLVKVPGGPLKLWMTPTGECSMPAGRYGAGADISTGNGATNSCLSIGDATTGEKVLEYATPFVIPEAFALIAVACCWLFQDEYGQPAFFAWEHHGPGLIFGNKVLDLGYRRIYFRESAVAGTNQTFSKTSEIPGWYPETKAKRVLIDEYRAALDMRQFVNHSAIALEECRKFHYSDDGSVEHAYEKLGNDPTKGNADPSGARINHADRVIADALCWKMLKSLGIVQRKKELENKVVIGSLAWRRQLAEHKEIVRSQWS